jgi:hypothetical protein
MIFGGKLQLIFAHFQKRIGKRQALLTLLSRVSKKKRSVLSSKNAARLVEVPQDR